MNILMVIPSFYPRVGGAEKQLYGLAAALVETAEFKIEIVTRPVKGYPKRERFGPVIINRIGSSDATWRFFLSLFIFCLKRLRAYDVIHLHTLTSPLFCCCLTSLFDATPIVAKVTRVGRNSQIESFTASFLRRLQWKFIKWRVSKFVGLTMSSATQLSRLGVCRDKIVVIPNGVLKPLSLGSAKSDDNLNVAVLGRMIKRKGIIELLDFLLSKQEFLEDVNFHFVGDGEELHYLKSRIRSSDVSLNIVFYGELDPAAVGEILSCCDIFMSNSYSEGLSNALLEGLASNCVPLVRDIPENREVVKSLGENVLFSDLDQMLLKLNHLRTMLGSDIHNEIEKIVKNQFVFEKVARSYSTLYKRLSSELVGANSS